ncbi:MAG TPA: PspC domain-containing protein [Candidatus Angelobacter sp.]|nr:PspC domain-containing protein [Candidatus Angelobacter sp.]
MYCNYCGKVIAEDANVCSYCGKRVAGVMSRERLVRPRQGRKVAGVCLGFAEYFDLDVALVRIVWLVCAIVGGFGALAYFAAWIVIPEEPLLLPVASPQPNQNNVVNT